MGKINIVKALVIVVEKRIVKLQVINAFVGIVEPFVDDAVIVAGAVIEARYIHQCIDGYFAART